MIYVQKGFGTICFSESDNRIYINVYDYQYTKSLKCNLQIYIGHLTEDIDNELIYDDVLLLLDGKISIDISKIVSRYIQKQVKLGQTLCPTKHIIQNYIGSVEYIYFWLKITPIVDGEMKLNDVYEETPYSNLMIRGNNHLQVNYLRNSESIFNERYIIPRINDVWLYHKNIIPIAQMTGNSFNMQLNPTYISELNQDGYYINISYYDYYVLKFLNGKIYKGNVLTPLENENKYIFILTFTDDNVLENVYYKENLIYATPYTLYPMIYVPSGPMNINNRPYKRLLDDVEVNLNLSNIKYYIIGLGEIEPVTRVPIFCTKPIKINIQRDCSIGFDKYYIHNRDGNLPNKMRLYDNVRLIYNGYMDDLWSVKVADININKTYQNVGYNIIQYYDWTKTYGHKLNKTSNNIISDEYTITIGGYNFMDINKIYTSLLYSNDIFLSFNKDGYYIPLNIVEIVDGNINTKSNNQYLTVKFAPSIENYANY